MTAHDPAHIAEDVRFWSNGRLASFEEADAACERIGAFTDVLSPRSSVSIDDLLLLVDAYQELRPPLSLDGEAS